MKRPLVVGVILLAATVAALSAMARPSRVHVISACPGKERWDVKTLSDPDASKVRINRWTNTTVAKLRLNKPPIKIRKNTPRLSTERTVYRGQAQLLEAKTESDGDIHLVIAEPGQKSLTMIAEFPHADCPQERDSPDVTQMDNARSAFEQI